MGKAFITRRGGGSATPVTPEYDQIINYTALFDNGDVGESGGWESKSNGSAVTSGIIDNKLKMTMKNYTAGQMTEHASVLGTVNAFNLSEYSKIYALFDETEYQTSSSPLTKIGYGMILSNGYYAAKGKFVSVAGAQTNIKCIDDISVDSTDYVSISTYYQSCVISRIYLFKPDDYTTLCTKAGISALADLATLLADTTSLSTILSSEEAVKWMVKNCTGDFMVGLLNSQAELVGASAYLNIIIANPHWAKFIMMICPELLNYTMLYDNGDECTDVTGGWTTSDYTVDIGSMKAGEKNTNHMYVKPEASNISCSTILGTANAIEMGDIAKVFAIANGFQADLRIDAKKKWFNNMENAQSIVAIRFNDDVGKTLYEEDAEYSGKYYMMIGVQNNTSRYLYTYAVGLLKSDNWQKWASKGNIASFTTLTDLLADSTAVNTLMANQSAVDYLAGCTGDLMFSICNSETAMTALVNNIAYDTLFHHPVWFKFMTMIPTSLEAMKNVAVSIPTMTSNTEPSGEVIVSSVMLDDVYHGWWAFNSDKTNCPYWAYLIAEIPAKIFYEFEISIVPFMVCVQNPDIYGGMDRKSKSFNIIASNDGLNFDVVGTGTLPNSTVPVEIVIETKKSYKYVGLDVVDYHTQYSNASAIAKIQVYGKAVSE